MDPTIKPNQANTYHRDGTVSFWDTGRQQWRRESATSIPDRVLASMSRQERRRVVAIADRLGGR